MSFTLSRRNLLTAVALGAAGAALAPIASAASERPFFKRVNLPIGLELYTVAKEVTADLDGTFARIAQIGFRQVEVSGYYGHTPAELRAACDRHGLACRSMHAQGQPVRVPGERSFETHR